MTSELTPNALIAKARRASESARLLLDNGDFDGACNRAYYAMFDAARAALLAANSPVPPEIAKTHSGLIAAFGLHIVKPGLLPVELGRLLNWADDLRLMADYKGDFVKCDDAREVVEQSMTFVAAVKQTLIPENRNSPPESIEP